MTRHKNTIQVARKLDQLAQELPDQPDHDTHGKIATMRRILEILPCGLGIRTEQVFGNFQPQMNEALDAYLGISINSVEPAKKDAVTTLARNIRSKIEKELT